MEENNLLPPVGLDVAENTLVNDFGVYWTYGITNTAQFFEDWKSMDCDLAAFTFWNLQLFVSGFLLLRHLITNVLGPNFKISSQIYFHCRNVILYIVLAALNFIDHGCIFYTKTLPSVMATQSGLSFTYFVKYLFLLLMLLFLVYFYIWAAYFILHISFNEFYLRLCYNLVVLKDRK